RLAVSFAQSDNDIPAPALQEWHARQETVIPPRQRPDECSRPQDARHHGKKLVAGDINPWKEMPYLIHIRGGQRRFLWLSLLAGIVPMVSNPIEKTVAPPRVAENGPPTRS